jgi:hypothetical protein
MLNRKHVFAGAAVILVLLAALPWFAPVAEPRPPADNHAASANGPAVAALPAPSVFSGVVDRPLFTPSRRPAAREAQPAAGNAGSRYRLIGVVNVGDTRRVWLSDGTRNFQIGENEAVDGWTVKRIEAERAILVGPAGELVLKLRRATDEGSAKPTPAAK